MVHGKKKHGKKSMTFNSDVVNKLMYKKNGIRLVRGRTQMIIPPRFLQNFVENSAFKQWYDQYFHTDTCNLQRCRPFMFLGHTPYFQDYCAYSSQNLISSRLL